MTYYDTFDWRLYHANLLLYLRYQAKQGCLLLDSLGEGTRLASVNLSDMPGFVRELPHSALRRRIETIVKQRALLPVAELQSHSDVFTLTDDEHKTVARLVLQFDVVGADMVALPGQLILDPVKGYPQPYQQLRQVIESELQLEPATGNRLAVILRAQGRTPGDYSTRLDIALDPGGRSDQSVKRILKVLYRIMQANEAGIKADIDSEFLHDYRVALRRIRTVLTQLKAVFETATTKHFKDEFGWLGEVTGPLRDLDVHLLQFVTFKGLLGDETYRDLLPLQGYLTEQRQQHYQELLQALQSTRYKRLLSDWEGFIDGDAEPAPPAANAVRPIKALADERIWQVYRKVVTQAGALTTASPAASFHELRKRCKKLRYLLEVFQYLYPPHAISRLIRHLKVLQENLGEYQDLHVQADTIKQLARQMARQGIGHAGTYLAMGALAGRLEQKMLTVHEQFNGCYAQFAKTRIAKLFRQLFAPAQRGRGHHKS